MRKKLIYLLALIVILAQAAPVVLASTKNVSGPMAIAIRKYKKGNYTGCLQDCQWIASTHPSNSLAYYYMAMSYVQAGKKDEAIKAYDKVLKHKISPKLSEYATTGKRCLETPDECRLKTDTAISDTPELDALIASPTKGALSDTVQKDFTQRQLNGILNKMNSGKELDEYNFRNFKDFSKQRSKIETNEKLAQAKPSEEEIAAALKVLNDAGISTNTQNIMQSSSTMNPEMAQLNALMNNGNSSNNNNELLNMMPAMVTQNNGNNAQYTPQMMQAVILNSMMSNMNFNLNNNENK